jgi:hypothetical protein
MKNTLEDLNNHLFAQLERLGEEETKGDALLEEINRARAVTSVAVQIISNGSLVLKGKHIQLEYGIEEGGGVVRSEKQLPPMLKSEFLKV